LPPTRAKVIEVDFTSRRRVLASQEQRTHPGPVAALQALERSAGFVIFWRPPAWRISGEYLGGRWDWGWTLFVWTSDAAVGPAWRHLVNGRGYVPQRFTRQGFLAFLRRNGEVEGLLFDGELEGEGHVIRADPDQLVARTEALAALDS
jgi:hypothetical protein